MKYYIAKGPLRRFGYEWRYSYYKAYPDGSAEAARLYSDGRVIFNNIRKFNNYFIEHHCKEISKEEYESIFEL